MGDTFNLVELLGSVMANLGAIKALTLWQKLTLAFYTLGSGAGTYGVSHDWKYALIAGLSFFVAHVHGQLQPSPKEAPQPADLKTMTDGEARKVIAGNDSDLLSSSKF